MVNEDEETVLTTDEARRRQAIQKIGKILFGRNNLIPSDFADARAFEVERPFFQDRAGVLIQFVVSHHALGKIEDGTLGETIELLLPKGEPFKSSF